METTNSNIEDSTSKQIISAIAHTNQSNDHGVNRSIDSINAATLSQQKNSYASQVNSRSEALSTLPAKMQITKKKNTDSSTDKEQMMTCTPASTKDSQDGPEARVSLLSPHSDACSVVPSSAQHLFLKLLFPSNIAGIIIGKSGESIATLQKQSQCRIKLSQPLDFYPGTSDRVCVLQGRNYESLKIAVALVLKKYHEIGADVFTTLKDLGSQAESAHGSGLGSVFSARVLVPNSASGLIIGKGGSNIKSIASSTSSKVQITQKDDIASVSTSERVVTITGNLEACTSCICKLLDVMAAQPNVSQYFNVTTSYKKSSGPMVIDSALINRTSHVQVARRGLEILPSTGNTSFEEIDLIQFLPSSGTLESCNLLQTSRSQPQHAELFEQQMPLNASSSAQVDDYCQPGGPEFSPTRTYRQALAPSPPTSRHPDSQN